MFHNAIREVSNETTVFTGKMVCRINQGFLGEYLATDTLRAIQLGGMPFVIAEWVEVGSTFRRIDTQIQPDHEC